MSEYEMLAHETRRILRDATREYIRRRVELRFSALQLETQAEIRACLLQHALINAPESTNEQEVNRHAC